MFGNKKEEKIISIEGMSCIHCAKKVENALKEIPQIKSVKIDLEERKAKIIIKEKIDNEILKKAIEELDYKVINIE